MSQQIPRRVLSESLTEAIAGREVRVALFTTFSFEPEFFELQILPLLFDQGFSHVDKLKRAQLEEAMRRVEHAAVYYDRRAIENEGSAQLDVARHPVRHPTGYFHPKVTLLLVGDEPSRSLVLSVSSANLTEAGYWTSVECAYVRDLPAGTKIAWKKDLLRLLEQLEGAAPQAVSQPALNAVRAFIKQSLKGTSERTEDDPVARIFCGQQRLVSMLEPLRKRGKYELEIISPFFEDNVQAKLVREIIATLKPVETRIALPTRFDGSVEVSRPFYEEVQQIDQVTWSLLPDEVTRRGRDEHGNKEPRRIHAKIYRLFSYALKHEVMVIGSANLTEAGHGARGGNVEACVILEQHLDRAPKPWLISTETEPSVFHPQREGEREERSGDPCLLLSVDWRSRTARYWVDRELAPKQIRLSQFGIPVIGIQAPQLGRWIDFDVAPAAALFDRITTSSFFEAHVDDEEPFPVLVCEEGMANKPSLLRNLTPEEILRFWSMLSREQQQVFLESKYDDLLRSSDLAVPGAAAAASLKTNSLFDQFSGIFHAFARLEEHVTQALEKGLEREAEYRLFGDKYDSLAHLLDKVLADEEGEPVRRYVMLLAARGLVEKLECEQQAFCLSRADELRKMHARLVQTDRIRHRLRFASDGDQFLAWFEGHFLEQSAAQMGTL